MPPSPIEKVDTLAAILTPELLKTVGAPWMLQGEPDDIRVFSHGGRHYVYELSNVHTRLVAALVYVVNAEWEKLQVSATCKVCGRVPPTDGSACHTVLEVPPGARVTVRTPEATCKGCGQVVKAKDDPCACLPYGVQTIATKETVWFHTLDDAWKAMCDGKRVVKR